MTVKCVCCSLQVSPVTEVLVATGSGSGVDAAAQSQTVMRIKGKLEALARVNIMQQVQFEERIRSQGSSGITVVRGCQLLLFCFVCAALFAVLDFCSWHQFIPLCVE